MKYTLINRSTNQEIICEKVVIDGVDYYVSDTAKINTDNQWVISNINSYLGRTFYPENDGTVTDDVIKKLLLSVDYKGHYTTTVGSGSDCRLVIATSAPNIDIPMACDAVFETILKQFIRGDEINEELVDELKKRAPKSVNNTDVNFIDWEDKPPFSESDVEGFILWKDNNRWFSFSDGKWNYTFEQGTSISRAAYEKDYRKTTKELIELWQLWKQSQQVKKLYYN
jgi:hypothetical protein